MIAFLISNFTRSNTGAGGHNYSLKYMFDEVKKTQSAFTVSIGNKPPLVFESAVDHVHINVSMLRLSKCLDQVVELFKLRGVSLIHCYDSNSSFIGKKAAKILRIPFVLTKCGGPKPKLGFFPATKSLILFHPADVDYFKNYKKFKNSHIYLLPNRTRVIEPDLERGEEIFAKKQGLAFVRVARIGKTYKTSILQSMELVRLFNTNGIKSTLFIIGYIQNHSVLNELKSLSDEFTHFHTEERYTKNANQLVSSADIVIGTGRSLIEGLSANKPVFFPVKGAKIPCLLDESTFHYAFKDNFSERCTLPESLHPDYKIETYLDLMSSFTKRNHFGVLSKKFFDEFFDIRNGAVELMKIYKNATVPSKFENCFDAFIHRYYLYLIAFRNIIFR